MSILKSNIYQILEFWITEFLLGNNLKQRMLKFFIKTYLLLNSFTQYKKEMTVQDCLLQTLMHY